MESPKIDSHSKDHAPHRTSKTMYCTHVSHGGCQNRSGLIPPKYFINVYEDCFFLCGRVNQGVQCSGRSCVYRNTHSIQEFTCKMCVLSIKQTYTTHLHMLCVRSYAKPARLCFQCQNSKKFNRNSRAITITLPFFNFFSLKEKFCTSLMKSNWASQKPRVTDFMSFK